MAQYGSEAEYYGKEPWQSKDMPGESAWEQEGLGLEEGWDRRLEEEEEEEGGWDSILKQLMGSRGKGEREYLGKGMPGAGGMGWLGLLGLSDKGFPGLGTRPGLPGSEEPGTGDYRDLIKAFGKTKGAGPMEGEMSRDRWKMEKQTPSWRDRTNSGEEGY